LSMGHKCHRVSIIRLAMKPPGPRGIPVTGKSDTRHMNEQRTRVVILGGGFGGLYTALELKKQLARHPEVEITLVNLSRSGGSH